MSPFGWRIANGADESRYSDFYPRRHSRQGGNLVHSWRVTQIAKAKPNWIPAPRGTAVLRLAGMTNDWK